MAIVKPVIGIGAGWVAAQIPLLLLCFGLAAIVPDGVCPWPMIVPSWRAAIGIAFEALGALLLFLALLHLGKNLMPFPRPKPDGNLVTEGIYRVVRHPMYGGIILLAFGTALRARTWLVLPVVALTLVFFDRKATVEEQWLIAKFDDYVSYRRNTSKLIPWLY